MSGEKILDITSFAVLNIAYYTTKFKPSVLKLFNLPVLRSV